VEQHLPAADRERQIAEFVEDDEIDADELVGQFPGLPGTRLTSPAKSRATGEMVMARRRFSPTPQIELAVVARRSGWARGGTVRNFVRGLKEGRIPPEWAAKPAKLRQKDRDARWTVKYTKAKPSQDGAPRVDLAIPAFG
jgi:hypothetical protein